MMFGCVIIVETKWIAFRLNQTDNHLSIKKIVIENLMRFDAFRLKWHETSFLLF